MAQNHFSMRSIETRMKITKYPLKQIETQETKRPVLSELGNRTRNSIVNAKKPESVTGLKPFNNISIIKPRVVNNLKNAQLSTETNKISAKTITNKNQATVGGPKLVKTKTIHAAVPKEAVKIQVTARYPIRKVKSTTNVTEVDVLPVLPKKSIVVKDNTTKALTVINENKTNEKDIKSPSHSTCLLNGVENIDLNDDTNPILISEYVNDIYKYLYSLETAFPIKKDYLHGQMEVTQKMRAVLIDWINEVHYQFHLVQETYFMAVSIIDRYLQAVLTTSRHNLQLVGVTALFIASKYEELYPPVVKDFVYITDDSYDVQQIMDMERQILQKLEFHLSKPLPIHFLRRYSKAANCHDLTYFMAKYFIEMSTVEYSLSHYRPSEMAAAALYLSQKLMNSNDKSDQTNESLWTPTMQYYTTYPFSHLKTIIKQLAVIICDAPQSKLKAVYGKYKQVKFQQIALRSELTGSAMKEACIF